MSSIATVSTCLSPINRRWKTKHRPGRRQSFSLSDDGAARNITSAAISAVDDDGAGHAGCMLDLPSAHR